MVNVYTPVIAGVKIQKIHQKNLTQFKAVRNQFQSTQCLIVLKIRNYTLFVEWNNQPRNMKALMLKVHTKIEELIIFLIHSTLKRGSRRKVPIETTISMKRKTETVNIVAPFIHQMMSCKCMKAGNESEADKFTEIPNIVTVSMREITCYSPSINSRSWGKSWWIRLPETSSVHTELNDINSLVLLIISNPIIVYHLGKCSCCFYLIWLFVWMGE